ncbi:hypothetical protein [Lactobacillus kimbladii]|nr:hypothetical protein [Lactobacillus kimbladii]
MINKKIKLDYFLMETQPNTKFRSCRTNINDAIDKSKFEVHPIWVTKEGHLADEKDFYKVLANPKYIIKNSNKITNISNMAQLANLPEIDIFFTIIHG